MFCWVSQCLFKIESVDASLIAALLPGYEQGVELTQLDMFGWGSWRRDAILMSIKLISDLTNTHKVAMMVQDEAYKAAEKKIEEAHRTGSTTLDLSGKPSEKPKFLTKLPESLSQLTQLKSLDLSFNKLTELPNWLCQLNQLQSLSLSHNQLIELPEWIGQLKQMKSLNLSHNELIELPEWIGQLKQMQSLRLAGIQLTKLPNSVGDFNQLTELELWMNILKTLPESMAQLSNLKRLSIWCEHSRLPLSALNGKDDRRGIYDLDFPREWFVKAAPFFKVLTGTLSLVLPVAASATKLALDNVTYKGIEKELDFGQKSIDSVLKGGEKSGMWLGHSDAPDLEQGEVIQAKGAILRQLHALLKEKDASFGGLVRVQNKRKEFLWVHQQFEIEY